MTGVIGRLRRIVEQSRIRLPPAPLRASELRPGDWVQLDSETWRVGSRRMDAGRTVFRLSSLHGTGALLVSPSEGETKWTLRKGGSGLSLPPEVLLVYRVG